MRCTIAAQRLYRITNIIRFRLKESRMFSEFKCKEALILIYHKQISNEEKLSYNSFDDVVFL